QRGIAMVFQSYGLYPHMNARKNMSFALELAKKSRQVINTTVTQAARILQMVPYLERLPKALSGGQRQRIAIGRAIVRDPKVYLFDEPLSNLDAALRVDMRVQIAALHKRLNATMIYVTHDQVEAMTLADRIVLLSKGRIAQVGAPLSLYHFPTTLEVAEFIGSPRINTLPVTVVDPGERQTVVRLHSGETLPVAVNGQQLQAGDRATLGLRAEDFVAAEQADATLSATLMVAEKLGYETLAHWQVEGIEAPLTQRLDGLTRLEEGQASHLGLTGQRCHLFDSNGNACPRQVTVDGVSR
ncbi:MAG: ATP-binding cassette domain-containing protein, partial [Pseudomonadota bacterium]|nr:ATP-binding cassette domain-containing protein [Pseudomonadota bacterium]